VCGVDGWTMEASGVGVGKYQVSVSCGWLDNGSKWEWGGGRVGNWIEELDLPPRVEGKKVVKPQLSACHVSERCM
jgi:hypothetical protein